MPPRSAISRLRRHRARRENSLTLRVRRAQAHVLSFTFSDSDPGPDRAPLGERVFVPDEPVEARELVVEDAGAGVVLLGGPVQAGSAPALGRVRHLLDQRPRGTLAARRLTNEQVLQVAGVG